MNLQVRNVYKTSKIKIKNINLQNVRSVGLYYITVQVVLEETMYMEWNGWEF